MNLTAKLQMVVRNSILVLTVATAAFGSHSAQAGAFAVDSRNGAWGCAQAREGDPARQYNLAVNRAVNRGGAVPYIRCAQFNLPSGTYVACSIGYVPGKGWCGNWAINGVDSADGLRRQNAYPWTIQFVNCWWE